MPAIARALSLLLPLSLAVTLFGCTIEDVEDEIRVVESVPRPSGPSAAHRLSRELGLGGESDRVEEGRFTFVRLRVLGPEGADLSPFLRINLTVRTSDGAFPLAEGADFVAGETERELDVLFTGNITPFLAAEDLTIEWDIFYRAGAVYPVTAIELEPVVGFSVDVRIL